RLTNNANSIQLDWDITAGGSPGGLVTIKRRALGEEDFKVVRTLPDDVTTYYDSSVDPNTFTGWYSITYQGAYDSTPDEKTANEAYILNHPFWLLSGSMATLCYNVDKIDEAVGLFNADKSAWADKANRVVIDASVASYPIESANGLFRGLSKVRSIEGMRHLNLQNVKDMSWMFYNCNSLTSLDLSAFNTENVTDMSSMFQDCNSLKSLDLSAFNTENVTNMSYMFFNCKSLTSLDLSAFNTENVTDMNNMFYNCSSLTSVDVSALNTENVTNMSRMFWGCNSLKSLDLSAFNTKNVTGMSRMFNGCGSLTSLNLASFSATGEKHPDLSGMFYGCSNLKTIYSHSFLWEAGCKSTDTFKGCTNLKGKVPFDSSRIDGDMGTFEGYFTPAIKGDLDGDGKLSIADITRLVKRMSQHGNTYHYQADMNEDGNVTLDDLKLLEERIRTDQPTPAPPTPEGE
ncbi:MAG: BspA family leucine-rich repeat surface protein, partial [Bacteroidaceae bacterium]|nr:BspA family leucine-rich repeat surface protein [Bacteroidaceae bacterium]